MKLRGLFMMEGAVRKRYLRHTKNFYYAAMYDAIRTIDDSQQLHDSLGNLKKRIVASQLPATQLFMGLTKGDKLRTEQPSLYHLVRKWKSQKQHHIDTINDIGGNACTTTGEKLQVFVEHLQRKLANIQVDRTALQMLLGETPTRLDTESHMGFQLPITEDEMWQAVKCGKKNKAPGNDGIPTEFDQLMWPVIKEDMLQVINDMYTSKTLPPIQTRVIIVCVPKSLHPATPEEYRLLTLLNSDIRIFARVLANRMRPWMRDMIHPSQYGCRRQHHP
jgi:hypothetical protein